MKRYWVITPYNSARPDTFDRAWSYDLSNDTIALGWTDMGDISGLTRAELADKYRSLYGDDVHKGSVTRDVNALWSFYHEIAPGDVIIARRGTKRIIGIGEVIGGAFYDQEKAIERIGNLPDHPYANLLPVSWQELDHVFDTIVFSFFTIYEIAEEKYEELIENVELPEDRSKEEIEFALEKYLEEFLIENFERIFGKNLAIYEDSDGGVGRQYPVVGDDGKLLGRIDILARDLGTDSYVIIELKKGRESDAVVGQTLRYMGWVEENLCDTGEKVLGLIICREVDEKLSYALKMVSGKVSVKKYRVDFELLD